MGTRNRFALVAVWALCAGIAYALTSRFLHLLPLISSDTAVTSRTLTNWVELVIMGAGAVVGAWWTLCLTLALVADFNSGARRNPWRKAFDALAPRLVKSLVAAIAGASIVAGIAPAGAAPAHNTDSVGASQRIGVIASPSTLHLGFVKTHKAPTQVQATAPSARMAATDTPASVRGDAPHQESLAKGTPVSLGFLSTEHSSNAPEPAAKQPQTNSAVSASAQTQSAGAQAEPSKPSQTVNRMESAPTEETRSPKPTSRAKAYTVQPGDSLWSIAQSRLPQGATNSEIATAWSAIYESNRAVIGDDPDFLPTGITLAFPSSTA